MIKTITLKHPIEFNGRKITEIVFRRRPKGKDMTQARRGSPNISDEDAQLRILANICEIEPEAIEELDVGDFLEVNRFLNSFFS